MVSLTIQATDGATGQINLSQPNVVPSPIVRNVFQQPFGINSVWNRSIGKGGGTLQSAGTGPHGGAQMKYSGNNGPVYEFAGIGVVGNVSADENLIVLGPSSPLQTVNTNTIGWSGGSAARCVAPQTPTAKQIPIPTQATYPAGTLTNPCSGPQVLGSTPNASSAVLMPDRRTLYQTQPFQICGTGISVTTQFPFPDGDIFADETTTPKSAVGSHGGSAMSAYGGSIGYRDIAPGNCPWLPGVADVMRHALSMSLNGPVLNAFGAGPFWPATNADAGHEGLLLALLPTFNINSLLSTPGKSLAWTAMNYGLYIVDNSGWDAVNFSPAYSYGDTSVNCLTGRASCQFNTDWGLSFEGSTTANNWTKDVKTILQNLYVITNNGLATIGGGGPSALQPLAAPPVDPGVITQAPQVFNITLPVSRTGLVVGQNIGRVFAANSPFWWSLSGTGASNFWIQPSTGLLYISATGAGVAVGTYTLTATASNIIGSDTGTVTIVVS